MTPPRTIVGTLVHSRLFRSRWAGRSLLAVLIALFVFLSFFPERYRAAATLTPTDPQTLGLSGALGQLGAMNSVFGTQAAVEVALRVARSVDVRDTVIQKTNLKQRMHFSDRIAMQRWLEQQMTIRSLRGGIILFETQLRDPNLGRDLISAYATATQARLAEINRRQTEYKRDVLLKLVSDASDRLARAQSAYDSFRLKTRYVDPEQALAAMGSRIPLLQSSIKAKEVELTAARQFYTEDNMAVRQIVAELSALKGQLAQAQQTDAARNDSVGKVVQASTVGEQLSRELKISRLLYEGYVRYLQGTSVEDLTSTASVRVLEPPFVDTDRQIDYRFAALALAIALLWGAIEFYRLRPPPGDRLIRRESHA